jgi:hypothetical protein
MVKLPRSSPPRKLPRATCMQQLWNNVRAESLRFSALAPTHCSIDLRFSFARGAHHSEKLKGAGNSRVTIPLVKRLFFQAFHSGIVTASGDNFTTKNILRRVDAAISAGSARDLYDSPAPSRTRTVASRPCRMMVKVTSSPGWKLSMTERKSSTVAAAWPLIAVTMSAAL